jgi:RES domain-containing protein
LILWRIVKDKHAVTAFDGEGARRFGGRWNSLGTAMVYGSATLSLAALEILVHLEVMDFGSRRVAIRVDVPAGIPLPVVTLDQLPLDWRDTPAPHELANWGDDWIRRGDSLLLAVPSAIVPQECNILINPRHDDFAQLRLQSPERFVLDPRLLKQCELRA